MTKGRRASALAQAEAHLLEVSRSGVETFEAFGSTFSVQSIGAFDHIDHISRCVKDAIRSVYGVSINPPTILAERTKSHRLAEYRRKERLIWFNMHADTERIDPTRRIEVSKLHVLHETAHHVAYMKHRVSDARAHGPAFIEEYKRLVSEELSPSMAALLMIYYYEALDLYKKKEIDS